MATQINLGSSTEIVPAKTADGWHLRSITIEFNSLTIAGMENTPAIFGMFEPWYDDNGTKTLLENQTQKVSITDPVRVGEIYDMYVKQNAQLGPVIEELVWKEAQAQLNIPQSAIDALGTNAQETPFV